VVIAVCAIVAAGLITIAWALVVLVRRMFGGFGGGDTGSAPPYGALPELGPVGALGGLSPDADISDATAGPDDLLGP